MFALDNKDNVEMLNPVYYTVSQFITNSNIPHCSFCFSLYFSSLLLLYSGDVILNIIY